MNATNEDIPPAELIAELLRNYKLHIGPNTRDLITTGQTVIHLTGGERQAIAEIAAGVLEERLERVQSSRQAWAAEALRLEESIRALLAQAEQRRGELVSSPPACDCVPTAEHPHSEPCPVLRDHWAWTLLAVKVRALLDPPEES